MLQKINKVRRFLEKAAHAMVGMPDYDTYVIHMKTNHPNRSCMTYEEFFLERLEARYNRIGSGRCC
jgi:uncharacterized short protein YbdD (DUF466 family)